MKRPGKPADLRDLTPANVRAILKAITRRCVRIAGAYGGADSARMVAKHEDFDGRTNIERCINAGWLAAGPYTNTYVATDRGRLVTQLWGEYTAAWEEYRAWREARDAKEKVDEPAVA